MLRTYLSSLIKTSNQISFLKLSYLPRQMEMDNLEDPKVENKERLSEKVNYKVLKPPEEVYMMTKLDKKLFEKHVKLPFVKIENLKVFTAMPILKRYMLKLQNFKPVQQEGPEEVVVHLSPDLVQSWGDISEDHQEALEEINVTEQNFGVKDFTLTYDNYGAGRILRAVLPNEEDGVSSFTKVGHIVHVNLREHLLPFKYLIGEVLFDKISGCQSVVNKTNSIDNTYRNFQMEILKGNDNMVTTVRESGCTFEFDFSKVYWNSRLSTEHGRIVHRIKVKQPAVVFDVFAGVGPFSIPAARYRRVKVFANDINPEAYKWLVQNKEINKINEQNLFAYNLDGKDFITNVIKEELPKHADTHTMFVIMNLPATAVDFLSAFIGLLKGVELPEKFEFITAYVYCFAKGEGQEELARSQILANLNVPGVNVNEKILDIFKIRTVSNNKEMIRVTIKLDLDILVGSGCSKRKLDDQNGQEQKEEQQCVQGGRSKKFKNESQS